MVLLSSFICLISINEWVHQPELDILHIGIFKVAVVQLSHDTCPTFFWVIQITIRSHVGYIQVIRTPLLWIIGQVQSLDGSWLTVQRLLILEYFPLVNRSHEVVGELHLIVKDMGWRTAALCLVREDLIDIEPRHMGTVQAIADILQLL